MREMRVEIFERKGDIISKRRKIREGIESRHMGYDFTFQMFRETSLKSERMIHNIALEQAENWREVVIILGLEYMIID